MFSSCLLIIKKKKNKRDIWYLFRFLFFSNLNCISHFIIDNRVISYLWNKFWIIKSLIINNNNDNFKIRGEWFNGIQWSHKDYVIIYFFLQEKISRDSWIVFVSALFPMIHHFWPLFFLHMTYLSLLLDRKWW